MSQHLQSLRQRISVPSTDSLLLAGVSLAFGAFALNTIWKFLDTKPSTPPATNSFDPKMSKKVVILGGGLSGVAIAHKLLKHTVPKLQGGNLKVVLISSSSHYYQNLAAVRGLIPGEIPDDKLWTPIEPGFKQYSANNFEFVVGTATSIDLEGNVVHVHTATAEQAVAYDHLVIATGSSLASTLPFKNLDSHEQTLKEWHALQDKVEKATSIVVAGAGPTGVETVAELAYKYGATKKITLVIAGERALPVLMPSAGRTAEAELAKMGVTLLRKTRVESVSDDGTKLTLSDGKTLETDLFLPLYGVRPNTSFVPSHLLDAKGCVKVDPTLRVKGTKNVWAIGDANDVEYKTAMRAESQVVFFHPNLEAALLGKGDEALGRYKPGTTTMMFVTLGKKKGTGQIGGWKPFQFMVSYVKGRTLFVEKAPVVVRGEKLYQNKM